MLVRLEGELTELGGDRERLNGDLETVPKLQAAIDGDATEVDESDNKSAELEDELSCDDLPLEDLQGLLEAWAHSWHRFCGGIRILSISATLRRCRRDCSAAAV